MSVYGVIGHVRCLDCIRIMRTENRKKTTRLARKYFYEQDVENDKHSSWLLNRSERQCVVCRVCARFSVEKWSRWECGVINIDPPPCLLVCSCLWLLLFYFFVHVCFSFLPLSPECLHRAWIWHTGMKRFLLFRKNLITFLLIIPIFNPQCVFDVPADVYYAWYDFLFSYF